VDWTLLVYMAADSDMERAALANIQEMAVAGSDEHVNVVVQIDRASADRDRHGFRRAPLLNLSDFSTTKRLLVKQGSVIELADIGETNTADPATLGAFVAWGIQAFPASHIALVIWGHGAATVGVGWDETSGGAPLSIAGLHRGLTLGLARAGRPKLDVLGFDACLMGSLGVTYELRETTEVVVASEENEPTHGWPYAAVVDAMARGLATRALATSIVRAFEAKCEAKQTIAKCTLAALDASLLSGVAASVDDLGFRLAAAMATTHDWDAVARARDASEAYGEAPGDRDSPHTVDASDFADKSAALLTDRTNYVRIALRKATIASMRGSASPQAGGLSLTFPNAATPLPPPDTALMLNHHTRWGALVDALFLHEAP